MIFQWTINLSKLGFEYIMVGPLTDINPNFANYNKEFVDFNKFKKFLDVRNKLNFLNKKLFLNKIRNLKT